jgi:A/G-specific adenine glycosylase
MPARSAQARNRRTAGADDGRFAAAVVAWQRVHGRHGLPWQNTRDAYRIWLSEIMLQQTQVAAVVPYYERFLKRFPTIAALAAADEDDVLVLWSGLGYYSRARNLHRAARQIAEQHAGVFPADFDAVLELPGVGRSTAAAICVFAFGARKAILDGNVKRVFARCFGVAGYPGETAVADALWAHADRLVPAKNVEAYTQGLMDLGAGICTRSKPRCADCPLAGRCVARKQEAIARYPAPRPRKVLPQRRTRMLVLLHAGQVLLEKRPGSGIWGGLWSLPEAGEKESIAACASRYGVTVAAQKALPAVAHGFTHFLLAIEPVRVAVKKVDARAAAPGVMWLGLADAQGAALPAPVRRILAALAAPATP